MKTPHETNKSCPTPETVGQLEARIREAAKAVNQCEEEVAKAEADEDEAKICFEDAKFETVTAHAHLIGKAFVLGGELDALDKQMASTKGQHREDTFRKRAIELLGNKNAVYRPLAIYRYLTAEGITSEEDAVLSAGDRGESYRTLAEIAQRALADGERSKRQSETGEPPKASKNNARRSAKMNPVARRLSASRAETSTNHNNQAAEDRTETTQLPIASEELAATKTFVAAVGGWTRAIYLITEGYQKWRQNQNG
jgi:hypothetical protein